MSSNNNDVDIIDVLNRAARTGVGTARGIIVDRQRIAELASELESRKSQEQKSADVAEVSHNTEIEMTKTATKSVASKTKTTADTDISGTEITGTEITGTEIGAGKQAEFGSLDEHLADICECQKCPLGATRTKFVYGVGSPTADLMFVGEAPGKNEDEQGEPFVGRAGKLLDKILEAIDMKRSEVYIANILKCRPPDNRDPQPAEMEHCFPYLKEQISIIKPKIICSLGRISAQSLLQNNLALGKMRGQWHSYQGIPLRVTYHPAALLRNPNFKRGCWEDMQIIQDEYKRLTS